MRQMTSTREMPAARTVAHILSGELRARSAVEHMRVAIKLMLEGLAIDQTDGTRTEDRPSHFSAKRLLSAVWSPRKGPASRHSG